MRRRQMKKQKRIIIISSLCLLLCLCVGYAAFNTQLSLRAKGNIKDNSVDITENVVTEGDGLYEDIYEDGRYVYKGQNPDNYIDIGDKKSDGSVALWRIISKEADGSYKLIKNDILSEPCTWDLVGNRDMLSPDGAGGTYCANFNIGCGAWGISDNFTNGRNSGTVTKDASLNEDLNGTYYNSLNETVKENIEYHDWYFGYVSYYNNDLQAQINSEKSVSGKYNIGLISVSDYLRANYNEDCDSFAKNSDNCTTCKTTNWIFDIINNHGTYLWTLNVSDYTHNNTTDYVFRIFASPTSAAAGQVTSVAAGHGGTARGSVAPSIYLKSGVTLTGVGSETEPFMIV